MSRPLSPDEERAARANEHVHISIRLYVTKCGKDLTSPAGMHLKVTDDRALATCPKCIEAWDRIKDIIRGAKP